MKIFWLRMKNYRQYLGDNTIEFSTEDGKSITIVEGTTGAGKTNILNAMNWCLYGVEPAFGDADTGVPPTSNRAALAEGNGSTRVVVELALGENEPKYFFRRLLTIWNTDKEKPSPDVIRKPVRLNNSERSTFVYLNSNLIPTVEFEAWTKERTGDKFSSIPDYLVQTILPRELAFVFLFNGEQLKEFFSEHANLQQALEDISQISLVNRTIDHLDKLADDDRRAASKGSKDTQQMSQDLDAIKQALEKTRLERQGKEVQIESLRKKIDGVNQRLGQLDEHRVNELLENSKSTDQRQKELISEINRLETARNQLLLDVSPFVFLREQMKVAVGKIEEMSERGSLPPPIRTIFLTDLLKKGVCICGRSVAEHDSAAGDARQHLETLLNEQSSEEAVGLKAIEGRFRLEAAIGAIDIKLKGLTNLGSQLATANTQLAQADAKAKSIGAELTGFKAQGTTIEDVAAEVRSLGSEKVNLGKALDKLIGDAGADDRDIRRYEGAAKAKEQQIRDELKKKTKSEELQRRLDFLEKSRDQLTSIRDSMVGDVRREIEQGTDQHFRELVWKTAKLETETGSRRGIDPNRLQKVVIDSNNEIKVMTRDDENWVRGLSQGETQTLAYAFISALKEGAKVAFPMVVDTPLGIIDAGRPRELFAELLPEFVKGSQLAFLMTSAEYTPPVQKTLAPKVGSVYKLVYDESQQITTVEKVG